MDILIAAIKLIACTLKKEMTCPLQWVSVIENDFSFLHVIGK